MSTKLDDGERKNNHYHALFSFSFSFSPFAYGVCGVCVQEEFIGKEITRIREICGPKGRVIGAVSGGVDSTVAAKLMHEAIGDRQVFVFSSLFGEFAHCS